MYSPLTFPKKYDKEGAYVRHWLPVLKARARSLLTRSVCSLCGRGRGVLCTACMHVLARPA